MGTITGMNGDFTIPNVPSLTMTLIVSYMGLMSQEVAIRPGKLNVSLKSDTKILGEAMVATIGISQEEKSFGICPVCMFRRCLKSFKRFIL